jgi:homoserine O-acetyltransferase
MPNLLIESTGTYGHALTGQPGAPVIVTLGGISATRRVTEWWGAIVGPGRAIDTTRFQVLAIDYLESGVEDDGRPTWAVTTHDQAEAIARALDERGLARVQTIVGASYGGMVALAFAERYPERLEQLVVISAPAKPHPMTTALRSIQRRIVELALETGRPADGLALARALGMTTYRSAAEFGERFASDPFAAEDYVMRQGASFAARFSAARFLALSLSCDLHCVDPTQITTPALLIAAEGDTLVPRPQMEDLARELGGPCRLEHIASRIGHDAFLAESQLIGNLIRNALTTVALS